MSIWGKLIGAAAGFALGGPIGLIVGVGAGHFVDRMARRARHGTAGGDDVAAKRVAFAVALIVLCAKMAKADGQVTRDEIDTFKRIIRIPPEDAAEVGRIFNQAGRDAGGFEPYAEQIAQVFAQNPAVREELLAALLHIAMADGHLHQAERSYLRRVAEIFGFDERQFERILASHVAPADVQDPYEILEQDPDASDQEIKDAYRRLSRDNHPDLLVAQGMPEEMVAIANEKMATINVAYDRIVKQRGMK